MNAETAVVTFGASFGVPTLWTLLSFFLVCVVWLAQVQQLDNCDSCAVIKLRAAACLSLLHRSSHWLPDAFGKWEMVGCSSGHLWHKCAFYRTSFLSKGSWALSLHHYITSPNTRNMICNLLLGPSQFFCKSNISNIDISIKDSLMFSGRFHIRLLVHCCHQLERVCSGLTEKWDFLESQPRSYIKCFMLHYIKLTLGCIRASVCSVHYHTYTWLNSLYVYFEHLYSMGWVRSSSRYM